MSTLALVLVLSCPLTQIIPFKGEFDARDTAMLNKAITRCGEKFPKSPCLGKFIVKAPGVYWATCTYKREVK
jgi:hypothetical protein